MSNSIILSTYNGEKYIRDQMQSLLNQTRQADEVFIFDDCSSDNTINIVNDFIKENQLGERWTVYQNSHNKGWESNFMDAISVVSGDIVFFCDQDDFWLKNKIEIYNKVFRNNQHVNVLLSPFVPWNGDIISCPELNDSYKFVKLNGDKETFWMDGPGCVLAFRRKYYDRIKRYYIPKWAHDDFFRKFALVDGTLAVLETPSILRRFHNSNASYSKMTLERLYSYSIIGFKYCNSLIRYIQDNDNTFEDSLKNVALLRIEKKAYENRINYIQTKKIKFLLKMIFSKSGIYRKPKQIARDILLVNSKKKK